MGADASVGDVNYLSGNSYVSWNWNAGTSTVTNTEGSVNAQVRANPTAGFSICSFTMGAGSTTIGHGLSQAPELIIFKATGATDGWYTQWPKTGNAARVMLNQDVAAYTGSSSWSSTSPTATVFTASINHSNPSIAYCFHSVPGFSHVGWYGGNFNADGSFAYTGFRPAFIMIKNADAAANWVMQDDKRSPTNPRNVVLLADTADAEANWSSYPIDILSNGFKIRNTGQGTNSAHTFLFLAFAEYPFKTTNAR